MKKFVLKIGILIAALLITGSILFLICIQLPPQYETAYNASIIDKLERLIGMEDPKIVLVGNSNVAFGIRSDIMERELEMPVVNLGLHGGLGNAFHEEMAKMKISEGDLVLVCHSEFSDDGRTPNPDLVWITIDNHLSLLKLIQPIDRKAMIKAFPNLFLKEIGKWITGTGNQKIEGAYSRAAFNEYGDVAYERPENGYVFTEGSIVVPTISDTCVERLNKLNQYCEERGAVLLIAGYPIAEGPFTPEIEEYQKFQQDLAEKLDCKIISNYTDYFIDYSYFYDTPLHLTSEGAVIRTEQLISDIQRYWRNSAAEGKSSEGETY